MTSRTKRTRKDIEVQPVGEANPPAPAARIDLWFDQELTKLYGEVTEEPVPAEILSLINKLKSPH